MRDRLKGERSWGRTVSTVLSGVLTSAVVTACGPTQVDVLSKRVDDLDKQLMEVKKQLATQTVLSQNLESDLFLFKDRLETFERNRVRRARSAEELDTIKVKPSNGPEVSFDPTDDRPRVARRDDPGAEPDCELMDQITPEGRVIRGCGKAGERAAETRPTPREVYGGPKPVPAPPKSEERVRPEPKASDRTAKALYESAMSDYKAGRLNEATDAFIDFVGRFPAHEYADNALYWVGECYYTRALWNKALELFTDVVLNYPMENKTSDAMLKIGLCHINLGNARAAREALTSLVEQYPDSPVAGLARQKLSEL